jgi:sporulation protein YlmC with PRC-barrel domain
MNPLHALGPAAGIMLAWLSVAAAQPARDQPVPPPTGAAQPARTEGGTVTGTPLLDRVSRVRGYDVVNPTNETIGSVKDLLIDRGSGRVEYLLIKSGGVMGVGGKTIAVPFARFSGPNIADRRVTVDMTKDEAERAAKFVPENWSELKHDTWPDTMDRSVRETQKNDPDTDPTATAIAAAMEEALGGEVVAVKREWTGPSENVIVELRTPQGTVRDLQLGPSWWVMSQPGAPMRGEKMNAKVRVITKDGSNPRYIVSNATVDGKTLVLRDSQFRPAWDVTSGGASQGARPSPGATTRAVSSRLVRASEILGAKTVALDKEGGEIQDAIMDVRDGDVIALCVDPNNNTFGWGDTIRAVPWSATTLSTDDKVHIDATQQMLTAAPEVPKDLNAQTGWTNTVYSTFGVPAPRPDRGRDTSRAEKPTSASDDWTTVALTGPVSTISGAASRPRNETLGRSSGKVHVVTVTSGSRIEEVVIAPTDYADEHQLAVAPGEQIEVSGRIMTLGGQRYFVAQRIKHNGRTTDIWSGDRPGWLKR